MKKIITITIFMSCLGILKAQESIIFNFPITLQQLQEQQHHFQSKKFLFQTSNKKHKTNADSFQRSIAYSFYHFNPGDNEYHLNDSTNYTWHKDEGKDIEITQSNIYGRPFDNFESMIDIYKNYELFNMQIINFEQPPNIKELTKISFNGTTFDTSKYEGSIIANGKLEKSFSYDFDSVFYFYNSNDQIIKTYSYNAAGMQIDSAIYNAASKKISHYSIMPSGEKYYNFHTYFASGKLASNTLIHMSATNTLISETTDSIFEISSLVDSIVGRSSSSTPPSYNLIYTIKKIRDANNNISKFQYNNVSFASIAEVDYTYNSTNQLTEVKFSSSDTIKVIFNYDANQMPFERISEVKDAAGNWQKSSYAKLTYNADNLVSSFATASIYDAGLGIFIEGPEDVMTKVYFETHAPEDVSINDVKKSNIKIFPNPASENLSIQLDDEMLQDISIIDAMGRLVSTYKINNKNSHTLQVKHLAAGAYTIQIKTNKGIAQTKFIKE